MKKKMQMNNGIFNFMIPHKSVAFKDIFVENTDDGIGIRSSLTVYEDDSRKLLLLAVLPDANPKTFYIRFVWITGGHTIFHKMYYSTDGKTADTHVDELGGYTIGDILTVIMDAYTERLRKGA